MFTSGIRTLAETVIAEGPPEATGYGTENLGRYVHTLAWMTGRLVPDAGPVLDLGIYPGHLALAVRRLAGVEVRGLGRFVAAGFGTWMAERGIRVDEVDLEREILPYPGGAFGGILATEVLEHVANPALLLTECWRVLRAGGRLFLTTPNLVDLRGRLRAARGRSPQSHLFGIERPFHMNEWVHRREYAPHEVARMLHEVGFTVSGIHTWTPTRAEGGLAGMPWLVAVANRLPGLGGTIFAAASKPERLSGVSGRTDRARIVPTPDYLERAPGGAASVRVRLANVGTSTWGAGVSPGYVLLGAHLLDLDGRVRERDLARAVLPRDIEPGSEAEIDLVLPAPAEAGVFLVELDLVREAEHWFGDDGSPPARVVLRVR